MNILIALIPAIGWGLNPLLLSKIGGKPVNQTLGTGLGALLVGIIVKVMFQPSVASGVFWLSAVSGACWVIGQIGQYTSYAKMGVSTTMPISTGLQLIGTSVIGVLMFGEWSGGVAKLIGFAAIILMIIGVAFTAVTDSSESRAGLMSGLTVLVPTTIGYWAYSALPKAVSASSLSIFFPQMLGIFVGAILYVLLSGHAHAFKESTSWLNIAAGAVFGVSALAYIFSAKANGVATAYMITQLSVVISTLGGMLVLGEVKSHREFRLTMMGLALIVIGSVMTAFL
ncbi:GRP family sugar transporter [Lactiplantibacillus mudanjiangensis]|uniref:Sugar transporter [Lactobacillus sp.] n=1 Tax=Lactiplantibacillus mudanjiangensis TaxID=1296538 RepID=A0A660E150_9LACO|nr:GRP family sugar transporter [Lactiplantibacillus mudanjiangensis]VDG23508.1 sugar transporter [Lactobacillus sp.] [Lactiplantibacillus mudanjiangensis]VDG27729.1 sugar transporter [Lactobacillus sp.] [Lactiplantibacillus mudanjiangensis]